MLWCMILHNETRCILQHPWRYTIYNLTQNMIFNKNTYLYLVCHIKYRPRLVLNNILYAQQLDLIFFPHWINHDLGLDGRKIMRTFTENPRLGAPSVNVSARLLLSSAATMCVPVKLTNTPFCNRS